MTESVMTIDSNDLYEVIQFAFSGSPFLILETMETSDARPVLGMPNYVIVDRLCSDWKLNNYPSGWIFDTTGELKWQKVEESLQIVYTGERLQESKMTSQVVPLNNSDFTRQEKRVYLWGKKVAKEQLRNEMGFDEHEEVFVELQIPQYLKYPVVPQGKKNRVQILVREFYNKTGQLEYYRFVNIVEA